MRIIRGASGSGKTALVFREFKEALRSGRRDMRIVVPTATLVRHFQHELARDGVVFPPASVISLSRFAIERTPASQLPAKQIPDSLLRAIVRDALRRFQPSEFAEAAATDGMAATILETIALFENAGSTPDRLPAAAHLNNHAKAFRKLWAAIDTAVTAAGYQTRAGIFREALHRRPSETIRPSIWLDGFLSLSPVESQFVSTLASSCNLTITDSSVTDEIYRFARRHNAQELVLNGPARQPQIEAIAAPGMEREADEISRRILRLRQQGTPFREIGVAVREPSIYHPLLQGTFDRFGISARFYFSAPLHKHPAATFLSGLVTCVLNGWEFNAALETLQGHPSWGQSSAFDRFDFKVREAMPGNGAASLLALCEEEFAKRVQPCFALDVWRTQQARPQEWARRLEEMARNLCRPGLIVPPASHRDLDTARSQPAALASWIAAIVTAADFWPAPQKSLSLDDFWRVAQVVVEGTALHVPDDRRDVVHVMSAFEARQWDLRTLFVCGMTDRDYPKRNSQNLLFPDADIDALGLPLRKASHRDAEEHALWESLKTRAQQSLILTWPEHDAGGNTVQSSRFLAPLNVVAGKSQLCRATPYVHLESAGMPGRIDAPELLTALAAQHQRISLSSLEDLVQCRFKFFASRTLSLKSRPERPQERLQKRITGLILHEALEAWLNNRREGDFVPLFELAFDRMVREKHLPQGFRLEVERILLREVARNVSATEQWTPRSSEAEVDLALDFPGGITVTCRVDRIDHMNDTDCVIVDYKSGRATGVEKLVTSKVKLQGPLYALAAKERLNLRTLAMMYVAVREDERYGWGEVPGANLGLQEIPPNWMEDARERSVHRLSSFLAGALQADPTELDGCRWCDFKEACRVEQRQALVMIEGAHGA